jgi:hypothetical protein
VRRIVAGGVVALCAAGVLYAAPAHADMNTYGRRGDANPYAFRAELQDTGLYHEDVPNAYSLGGRVCAARARGFTEEQIVSSLDNNYGDYTAEQAVEIVMGGEYHFCPAFFNDGTIPYGSRWYGPPIL